MQASQRAAKFVAMFMIAYGLLGDEPVDVSVSHESETWNYPFTLNAWCVERQMLKGDEAANFDIECSDQIRPVQDKLKHPTWLGHQNSDRLMSLLCYLKVGVSKLLSQVIWNLEREIYIFQVNSFTFKK